jgi:5-methylcytosine-specific restriction endonuclease McrA
MNKKTKFIKLPKEAVQFLKLLKGSEIYNEVPSHLKGIVTQSIRKKGALNNNHLKLLNQAIKYKGASNILDKSQYIDRISTKKIKKSETIENNETKSNYPFDIHWKSPKGNTPKKNYELYIESKTWKRKRNYILDKRGNKCQAVNCSNPVRSKSKLHCHHLTYKRFGCEEENDLQILCEDCHNKAHEEQTIREMQERFETSYFKDGVEYNKSEIK